MLSVETGFFGDCLFSSSVYSLAVAMGVDIPQGDNLVYAARSLRRSFISWITDNLDNSFGNLDASFVGNANSSGPTLREAIQREVELGDLQLHTVQEWLNYYGTNGEYVGDVALVLFSQFTISEFGRGVEVMLSESSSTTLEIMSSSTFTGDELQTTPIRLLFHPGVRSGSFDGHFTALQFTSEIVSDSSSAAVHTEEDRPNSGLDSDIHTEDNSSGLDSSSASIHAGADDCPNSDLEPSVPVDQRNKKRKFIQTTLPTAKPRKTRREMWSKEEDDILVREVNRHSFTTKNGKRRVESGGYGKIVKILGRTKYACISRFQMLEKAWHLYCRSPHCQKKATCGGFCKSCAKHKAPKEYIRMNERVRNRIRKHYHTDPFYRLRRVVQSRTSCSLRSYSTGLHDGESSDRYLRCTWSQLYVYIESMFYGGMCWLNMGLWHVSNCIVCI